MQILARPLPDLLDALRLRTPHLPPLSVLAIRFAHVVMVWDERRRTRSALAKLTPEQLTDVGLSTGSALREADKPFWRA